MQPCTTPTPPLTERQSLAIATDHREAWASILPGLQALHESSETQDWTIDGIRALLDQDLAILVVDASMPSAFAIVVIDESPYHPERSELFVHLAWHPGGDALPRFQPQLEFMARRIGASSMRFYSGRRGMLRLATRCGYAPRSVEYLKEL